MASNLVQSEMVLTVAESKRLIAKGVAGCPVVRKALQSGTVIVTKGSTNAYVAEELIGRRIERYAYVLGRTLPAKGGQKIGPVAAKQSEVILRNGSEVQIPMDLALEELKAGDVVIKGANAVDTERRLAGILIGHPQSGTIGKVWPVVVARKAHLVVPIGLEKLVAGDLHETAAKLRDPVDTLEGDTYSMFVVSGEIITELEALRILTGVEAFQAAAGGIGGAEGAVRIVVRGTPEAVQKAIRIVASIQGEPAFVE